MSFILGRLQAAGWGQGTKNDPYFVVCRLRGLLHRPLLSAVQDHPGEWPAPYVARSSVPARGQA